MSSCGLLVRKLYLSDEMRDALEQYLTDDRKVAPGQLRRRGDWLYLTYLKVVKIKNFDVGMWDLAENEVNTVRMTGFRLAKGKLLCSGSRGEIKEIAGLFDALALQVSGSKSEETLNYGDYYQMDPLEVDLGLVLEKFEKKGKVADIRKLWIKDMEVKLGSVRSCCINTTDYGGVRKLITQPGNHATAMELQLREPEKTFLSVNLDGGVKVISHAAATDVDLEDLAVKAAMEL